jgi:hypothetical protein
MNRIRTLVPLIAAAILQTTPLLSGQQSAYVANVPFQFAVANTTLPAGTYRLNREGAFLHLQNEKRSAQITVTLINDDRISQNGSDLLVFDEVNGRYFFRELYSPSSGSCMKLALSRMEKQAVTLAAANGKPLSAPSQVTVAMGAQ